MAKAAVHWSFPNSVAYMQRAAASRLVDIFGLCAVSAARSRPSPGFACLAAALRVEALEDGNLDWVGGDFVKLQAPLTPLACGNYCDRRLSVQHRGIPKCSFPITIVMLTRRSLTVRTTPGRT